MQRKNSLLVSKKRGYKNAIAMIMAVSVIIVIATILALSLSLTNITSKKTSDLYLYEQAAILAHSAAEYAVLEMSQSQPCSLSTLNFTYNSIYNINASMRYITLTGSTCNTNAAANGVNYETITYAPSNGTVILDITVNVDPTVTTEPIRYFRRTIQKL